jgi:hypothetical protein
MLAVRQLTLVAFKRDKKIGICRIQLLNKGRIISHLEPHSKSGGGDKSGGIVWQEQVLYASCGPKSWVDNFAGKYFNHAEKQLQGD